MLTISDAWLGFHEVGGWDTVEQAAQAGTMHPEFVGVVGSISHGTHDPKPDSIDDIDLFAVVQPPAKHVIGLGQWEHWNGFVDRYDVVVHALTKYVRMLLKGNPNVLCTLFLAEDHFDCSETFRDLIENRSRFVSRQAFRAFHGYATNQYTRMSKGTKNGYMGAKRKELLNQFGYDPKMAAHTIRLWTMAIEFAETGNLEVYRTHDAEHLKAVKRGDLPLQEIFGELAELQGRAAIAEVASELPEHPDTRWAEDWLMRTTLQHLVTTG